MKNQFSLYDLLILFGIVQGVIISFLLIFSKKNARSNKFLGLGLLSFCFLSSKTLLHTLHFWDTATFRFFPIGIELAIPPLFFYYVKSLVTPNFRFKTKHWLHFIPFFLSQTHAFIVYFLALQASTFIEKDHIANVLLFNQVKQVEEYLLLVSLVFYMFYGYKELKDYKQWLNNTISDSTFPDFNWLRNIFRSFILVGIFLLINHSLDIFFNLNHSTILHWNLLILFITFLIYYLGLKGLLQPDYPFTRTETMAEEKLLSTLPDSKEEAIIKQLKKVMHEDKIYLNPKLTIYKLSNTLGIHQRDLSQIINQHFKLSFREYINNHRVGEVKSKLNNTKFSHISILGIALESGFNSEASFYRIFKKHTGLSPKEFLPQKNGQ